MKYEMKGNRQQEKLGNCAEKKQKEDKMSTE